MKVIVKENNKEKIDAIINEVEGKATSRRISSTSVFDIVEELNKRLLALVCKKNLKGTKACVDYHAQDFAKAYRAKGTPRSTWVEMEYNGKDWVLTDVKRDSTASSASAFRITYTEKAKQDIVAHMEKFEW